MSVTPVFDGEKLIRLARDRSSQSRAALVQGITALPLDGSGGLSDRERGLMFDILAGVVRDAEMAVRRTVSACLADVPNAPRDLVRLLANDDIEIAHPVLAKSGALQDEDLIDIVRHRTMEHQLAVTLRPTVSIQVSDALVAGGHENVIRSLLNNPNADISRKTMEYLVEESQRVNSFQEPLVRRRDLDPELVKRMFVWVSAAIRQKIIEDWQFDVPTIDGLLERATVREIQAAAFEASEARKVDQLVELLEVEGKVTPEQMLDVLEGGEVSLFFSMFRKFTGLGESFTKRLLFEQGGDGLAVVCKAAGIGKAIFARIFALTRLARPVVDEAALEAETRKSLDVFNETSRAQAYEIVQRWQQNAEPPVRRR